MTGVNGNDKQGSAIIPQRLQHFFDNDKDYNTGKYYHSNNSKDYTLGNTIIQTNNILPLFN
jgi:hypothetical protein